MGRDALQKLWIAIVGLGARRLMALATVGAVVLAVIAVAAIYLGKPQRELLYSGLTHDDVGRIGSALRDSGIEFDVSPDGTSIDVNYGLAAKARMDLAQKGLPQNSDTGYEIFNNVGSFGLTTFMQDVTKTRALEGELTRSIESMKGIASARVHIVLPDRGSFRSDDQSATASVVIGTTLPSAAAPAQAIRLLVSAAVPGLTLDNVNVLSTDGTVLAASGSAASASTGQMASVEQGINTDLEAKIRRTLTPYIGLGNFQVSVSSTVNLDRTTTSETTFDPASRVERSVKSVTETTASQNSSAGAGAASVSQEIPTTQTATDGGNASNENNNRREDTTNYELSTKTVATAHDGYRIDNLSIAVLVNQDKLAALAAKGPDALPVEHQTMEIEQLVSAAAGLDHNRGDQLKVSAVSFVDDGAPQKASGPGLMDSLMAQFGAIFNALAMIVVAVIAVLFGLRPAVKMILSRPGGTLAATAGPGDVEAAIASSAAPPTQGVAGPGNVNLIEDVTNRMNRSPQKRLEQIVEYDEAQAAAILRQWLHQDEAA